MFKVPIDKIVPVTNARAKIASLVSDVQKTKSLYVLTRGGKPAAILASIDFITEKLSNPPQTATNQESLPEKYEKPDELPVPETNASTEIAVNMDDNTQLAQTSDNEEQPVKISIK